MTAQVIPNKQHFCPCLQNKEMHRLEVTIQRHKWQTYVC